MERSFNDTIKMTTIIDKDDFKRLISRYMKGGEYTFDDENKTGVIKVVGDDGKEMLFYFGKDEGTGIDYAYVGREDEDAKFVTKGIKLDKKSEEGIWKVHHTSFGSGEKSYIEIANKKAVEDGDALDQFIKDNEKEKKLIIETRDELKKFEAAELAYKEAVEEIQAKTKRSKEVDARIAEIGDDTNGPLKDLKEKRAEFTNVSRKLSTAEEKNREVNSKLKAYTDGTVVLKDEEYNTLLDESSKNSAEINSLTKQKGTLEAEIAKLEEIETEKKELEEEKVQIEEFLKENTEEKAKEIRDKEEAGLKKIKNAKNEYAKKYLESTDENKNIETFFDKDIKDIDDAITSKSIEFVANNPIIKAQAIANALVDEKEQPKFRAFFNLLNDTTPVKYAKTVRTKDDKVGTLVIFPVVGTKGKTTGHTAGSKDLDVYFVEGMTAEEFTNKLVEKPEELIELGGRVCEHAHFNEEFNKLALEVYDQTVIGEDGNLEKSDTHTVELNVVEDGATGTKEGDLTVSEVKDIFNSKDGQIYTVLKNVKTNSKGEVVSVDGNGDNFSKADYDAYTAVPKKTFWQRHPILKKAMIIGLPIAGIALVTTAIVGIVHMAKAGWFKTDETTQKLEESKEQLELANAQLKLEKELALAKGAAQAPELKGVTVDTATGDPIPNISFDLSKVDVYKQLGRTDELDGEPLAYNNKEVYSFYTYLGYFKDQMGQYAKNIADLGYPTTTDGKLNKVYFDPIIDEIIDVLIDYSAYADNVNIMTVEKEKDFIRENLEEVALIEANKSENPASKQSTEISLGDVDLLNAINDTFGKTRNFYDVAFTGKDVVYAHDKDSDTLAKINLGGEVAGKDNIVNVIKSGKATYTEFMNMNKNNIFNGYSKVENTYATPTPTLDKEGKYVYKIVEVKQNNDGTYVFDYFDNGKAKVKTTGNSNNNTIMQALATGLDIANYNTDAYIVYKQDKTNTTEVKSSEVTESDVKEGKVLQQRDSEEIAK